MRVRLYASIAFLLTWICPPAWAGVSPQQVLVVYNSRSTDAQSVLNAYLLAHPEIPIENVFNLDNTVVANRADVSYAEFKTQIRDPIRSYIDQTGAPTAEEIVSICLIRGIPHRIQDTDNPAIGENPAGTESEFMAGDATCASVDAELVLLWQDLDATEAGGTMDSRADNLIDNPYHGAAAEIQTFSRAAIKSAKTFGRSSLAWRIAGTNSNRLTPGDIYLVSRIDAATAGAAIGIIGRAANLHVNRRYAWVILDEDARTDPLDDDDYRSLFGSNPDYERARDKMTAAGFNVLYDNTAAFTTAASFTRPVIAYASYGENHNPNPPGAGTYINGFSFAPGAIFNTIESYNGRAFNGLGTLFSQEQVVDFITAGGTFAVGHVWEPLAFSVPDNEYLLDAMLVRGMCWAEAAWTAIPALSWMHVVVGDPLARVVAVIDQPADFDADADVDAVDLRRLEACATGPALGPPVAECMETDLNTDGSVDQIDFAILQRCMGLTPEALDSQCAEP